MCILTDGIVAFLAAVGITTMIWLLADQLLRRREPALRCTLVLPVRGTEEEVDWAVYTACRLRCRLRRQTAVVLLDCGLEETGRLRAEVLAENNRCMTVLLPSQLKDFMT